MELSNKKHKLANDDLEKISGGEIWRHECPECGVRVPSEESPAGKEITRDGCHPAVFCEKCSELVDEKTFDEKYEFYTWESGLATFGKWRKKKKSVDFQNDN